ncbi:MAG: hypothetical protein AB7Q17_16075 [Phycisphaerae bacterium]
MMKKSKLMMLSALVAGATLFQNGCLGSFWDGFFNGGWPNGNRWLNIAIDVLNEELFG